MDMNRRPQAYDRNIVEGTVREWSTENRGYLQSNEFIFETEKSLEGFIERMSKAINSSPSHEVYKIAAYYAGSSSELDDDVVELVELLVGHNDKVYRRHLKQWLQGWGPSQPFESVARVTLKNGDNVTGLGMIDGSYKEFGRLKFLPDNHRADWVNSSGHITRCSIHNWEDIESVEDLIEIDKKIWDRHLDFIRAEDLERKERQIISTADRNFDAMIKANSKMAIKDAKEIYDKLDLDPETAGKYVAALTMVAKAHLITDLKNRSVENTSIGPLF